MGKIEFEKGSPLLLGATPDTNGVNFALFSKNATSITLALFNTPQDKKPSLTYTLDSKKNKTGDIWHTYARGLKASSLYLYFVTGPRDTEEGLRFQNDAPLFDPYCKAFTQGSVFLAQRKAAKKGFLDLSKYPKCIVIDDNAYNWEGDLPLNYTLNRTIIYEAHLKGYTAASNSSVQFPGTYKGFIQKLPYIKALGVTSIELLPIFEFDENENFNTNPRTGEELKNYWGYSTIGFFAPKTSYAADKTIGGAVEEFKDLVKEAHKEGLEIILDVVFNHTAEGNERGYTFSFRGLENSTYYLLPSNDKAHYMNYSGCGNTFNCGNSIVTSFIIDCLRYWVATMHVDGFRFDLAPVLCRDTSGNLRMDNYLTCALAEDPILSKTKLIAEPWDCGGGYLVGSFPGGRWSEWNDHYKNDIRRFIRGDDKVVTDAATRIAGSSDLYNHSGRTVTASINFLTSHDGFTLNDVVCYNVKHNGENGEDNRDGDNNNNSYNHGFEGPTFNPKIENLRLKKLKNFLLCLLVSQGVPMIVAGDEARRTQGGNNNAYCQDNDISYMDWQLVEKNKELVSFFSKMTQIRNCHHVFHREHFFSTMAKEIVWYNFDGKSMEWQNARRFLAFTLNGERCINREGKSDNDFYIAGNTDIYDVTVTLPATKKGEKWYLVTDTSIEGEEGIKEAGREELLKEQKRYVLVANSFMILISK